MKKGLIWNIILIVAVAFIIIAVIAASNSTISQNLSDLWNKLNAKKVTGSTGEIPVIDRCSSMTDAMKIKIEQLKKETAVSGGNIVLREGETVREGDYFVARDEEYGNQLFRVEKIDVYNKMVVFRDILANSVTSAYLDDDNGRGRLNSATNRNYYFKTTMSSDELNTMTITWGHGAIYEDPGVEIDTFDCLTEIAPDDISITNLTASVTGNLIVGFSKNFAACADLLTEDDEKINKEDVFCGSGNITIKKPFDNFINLVAGKKYKLCRNDDYNICSYPAILKNETSTENLVDRCSYLDESIKQKMIQLTASGEKIILKEGEAGKVGDYFVTNVRYGRVPDSSTEIFKIEKIESSVRKMTITNAITGVPQEILLDNSADGKGTITAGNNGNIYASVNTRAEGDAIKLTWGEGSGYGDPGDESDTFYCTAKSTTLTPASSENCRYERTWWFFGKKLVCD